MVRPPISATKLFNATTFISISSQAGMASASLISIKS